METLLVSALSVVSTLMVIYFTWVFLGLRKVLKGQKSQEENTHELHRVNEGIYQVISNVENRLQGNFQKGLEETSQVLNGRIDNILSDIDREREVTFRDNDDKDRELDRRFDKLYTKLYQTFPQLKEETK